jgi:hypothetical protein
LKVNPNIAATGGILATTANDNHGCGSFKETAAGAPVTVQSGNHSVYVISSSHSAAAMAASIGMVAMHGQLLH